jgi:hypothetical protein
MSSNISRTMRRRRGARWRSQAQDCRGRAFGRIAERSAPYPRRTPSRADAASPSCRRFRTRHREGVGDGPRERAGRSGKGRGGPDSGGRQTTSVRLPTGTSAHTLRGSSVDEAAPSLQYGRRRGDLPLSPARPAFRNHAVTGAVGGGRVAASAYEILHKQAALY